MKIRAHRGLLADSMQTVEEISPTYEAIREYFKKDSPFPDLYDGHIEVKPYGYDDRIKWNTHIVIVSECAIGFTDGPVNPNLDLLNG